MEITFLGTGTSIGVPVIGCSCKVCSSDDQRDQRTRCSVYVKTNNKKILIDTTPELRLQFIREGLDEIDFILFTHDHADHIMGLDDVRPVTRKKENSMPCYGSKQTLREIEKRFHYIFNKTANDTWRPKIKLVEINKKTTIEGLEVSPLPVLHGKTEVFGYRIGDFAYISDVSEIPEETIAQLYNLDTLVIEALRFKPHYTHFNFEKAFQIVEQVDPKKTYLTHISHAVEHETVSKDLPENIFLAYDGLRINIPEEKE